MVKAKMIESMHYKVRKEDHDKMVAAMKEAEDYQRENKDLIHYSLSRTWFREDPADPKLEDWMFIDEFEDHEDYARTMKESLSDKKGSAYSQLFGKLIVPGSCAMEHEVWTEIDELHVDMESGK